MTSPVSATQVIFSSGNGLECAVGNENMQVRVKVEVVAKGLDGDDHAGLAFLCSEAGTDHIAQAQPCGLTQVGEQLTIPLKGLAQPLGKRDDNLPVGNASNKACSNQPQKDPILLESIPQKKANRYHFLLF
jgi:hypothetical protein